MTILLIIYAIIIIAIACTDFFKVKNFDDFVLAGRRRGLLLVTSSILASVIGASATMGVVKLAYSSGPVAFLWLGSGAVGLLISGLLITSKVRDTGSRTLVEAAQILIGQACGKLIAFIIVIAWTGIVAVQFIAAAKLVESCGNISYLTSLVIASFLITGYCVAGGQLSVLKTDLVQFAVMIAGIIVTMVFLYLHGWNFDIYRIPVDGGGFTIGKVVYFMLVVGSGFVIGPDIFSRYFSAGSNSVAKRAAISSSIILMLVSGAIVTIGLWVRKYTEVPEGQEVLIWVLSNYLPPVAGITLSLGLLSAIVSSADTCLVTASAIVSQQVRGGLSVKAVRGITLVIGIAAFAVAWLKADIIKTLILSYSIFNCGVIAPLMIAILLSSSRRLNQTLVMLSIICGGSLGLYANFSVYKQELSIAAFCLSTVLAILAVIKGKSKK